MRTERVETRSTYDKMSIEKLEERMEKLKTQQAEMSAALKAKKDRERKAREKAEKALQHKKAVAFLEWGLRTRWPDKNATVYDVYNMCITKKKPSVQKAVKSDKTVTSSEDGRSSDMIITSENDGLKTYGSKTDKEDPMLHRFFPICNDNIAE